MKKILLLIIVIYAPFFGFSQADSILMGAGYSNQVYYSLTNGEIQSSDNTSWDLAFGIGGFNTDIRINDGFDVKLYLYPNGDTSAWNTIDTNGLQNWTPRYNSDTSWSVTAFAGANISHPDYGWGVYNSITHNVEGDSIYILKLTDGSFKKFKMNGMLTSGEFTFTYADIDGSNEVNGSINKLNYEGKNFVYYSVKNDSIMDLEPMATEWDFVFTKYAQLQPQGSYYNVTGVLANKEHQTAEARDVDIANTDWYGQDYSSEIGIIGSDWKYFDMGTFSYKIQDSLTYFVVDTNNAVFQLTFTSFEGSSTGKTVFNKTQIGNLSVSKTSVVASSIRLFPNPAIESVTINIESETTQNDVSITIYSLTGRVIYSTTINVNGNSTLSIPVSQWQKGMYLVRIGNDENAFVKQLIVK